VAAALAPARVRLWHDAAMRNPLIATVAALTLTASLAGAAEPAPKLTTAKLGENLTLIAGPGGNVAVLVAKDHAVVIDDEVSELSAAFKKTLAGVTPKPVRFVINTHWHGDHTGNNAQLAGSGSVIIAHDNVRKRLSTEQFSGFLNRSVPASPQLAWPVLTFADSVSLHVGDEQLDVVHVGPAHTDGDAVVWFKQANVVHMGDTFFTAGYPFVDLGSGGSLDGYIKVADQVLAQARPDTKIIPGHGALGDKAKLKEFRDMLATVRDRVKKAVAANKTVAEAKAAHLLADLDPVWGKGFINGDQFVEMLYPAFTPKH
jgi:cyclase